MNYAEPASQRELTDGREMRARRRTQPVGCPSSRHDWGEVAAADRAAYEASIQPPASTLSDARRMLELDDHAAYMVAACVSTTQSSNETRPAFVKRIVRAWIDEMGRPR